MKFPTVFKHLANNQNLLRVTKIFDADALEIDISLAYTILLLLCFQESPNISKKCFSTTTGDCKFLADILHFTSNFSALKISFVELIMTNFSQALMIA